MSQAPQISDKILTIIRARYCPLLSGIKEGKKAGREQSTRDTCYNLERIKARCD